MKTFIFLSIICLVSACDRNRPFYKSYLDNQTGQSFNLHYYKNGVIQDKLSFIFSKGEKKILFSSAASIGDVNPYLSLELENEIYPPVYDSLKIVFSNQKSLTYYNKGVIGNNRDAFAYENSRNLYNDANWVKSKDGDNTNYTFTYTKEDYLLAK
jgi:hypothetical protein